MKLFFRTTVTTFLLGVFVTVSFAADGKTLYRNNCKVCHDKASKNGTYTPMTLTQDQWKKFFSVKLAPAHKSVTNPSSGKGILETISPEEMKSIEHFCVDHAADSEQPATCG